MRIKSFRLQLTVWYVAFFSLLFMLFSFFLYGALGLFSILVLNKIRNRDVGSLSCEQHGHRTPNAGIGPRNQRDLPLEFL